MVSALSLRPTVQRRWKEQDWTEIHMWGASSAKGRLLVPRSHSGGSTQWDDHITSAGPGSPELRVSDLTNRSQALHHSEPLPRFCWKETWFLGVLQLDPVPSCQWMDGFQVSGAAGSPSVLLLKMVFWRPSPPSETQMENSPRKRPHAALGRMECFHTCFIFYNVLVYTSVSSSP